MEKSSYSYVTVKERIIPGFVPGILFSKYFDEMHKHFTGSDNTKHLDTITKRIDYLSSLGSPYLKEMITEYIFNDTIEYINSNVFIDPDYKSITVFIQCESDFMYGAPSEVLYIWNCIKPKRKRIITDVMCKITSIIYNNLMNHNDNYWIESELDNITSNPNDFSQEEVVSAKEAIKRIEYIDTISDRYRHKSLDDLMERLKHNDIVAYDIVNKYIESVYAINSILFRSFHFMQFAEEMNSSLTDSSRLFFNVIDEPDSYLDSSLDYSREVSDGMTNMFSNFTISESEFVKDNLPESIYSHGKLFQDMISLFNEIEKHLLCN